MAYELSLYRVQMEKADEERKRSTLASEMERLKSENAKLNEQHALARANGQDGVVQRFSSPLSGERRGEAPRNLKSVEGFTDWFPK